MIGTWTVVGIRHLTHNQVVTGSSPAGPSTDGFKDYDEVVIEVQQFWLKDITPNPTASTTNISYQIEGASSAYLMVLNGFGTVNNNYIITPNSNQVILDVSGYTPGVYNVILIVDGQAVDAKSLVVQ